MIIPKITAVGPILVYFLPATQPADAPSSHKESIPYASFSHIPAYLDLALHPLHGYLQDKERSTSTLKYAHSLN
jgi:hypothetical protein